MKSMLRRNTKEILEHHGINLSKKRGQSQLVDEDVLERIVDYSEISLGDTVLEIGPGIGNLTAFLLEEAALVIAVEKDERLINVLRDRFRNSENLELIGRDVLETDLPDAEKIVSNLPYSISSPITFQILRHDFDLAILMYQKEFAKRMIASCGSSEYSRLSVGVAYRCDAEILEIIPPEAFLPKPEVKSAIVELRRKEPSFEVLDDEFFHRTVKAAFQHRRKKVKNSIFYSFSKIFPEFELDEGGKKEFLDEAIPTNYADKRAGNIPPKGFGKIANSMLMLSKSEKSKYLL